MNPVALWVDPETHRIEISGPRFGTSQKFRNLQVDPRTSFVVDDMADEAVGPGGQTGRGLEVRGWAEVLRLDRPLRDGFGMNAVRVHPRRVIAWNLDGPGRNARDVVTA